ncbi:aldehyde oxidase and xanthine dehydrogenase [Pelomyxa schiedti]|nr:aldehyde oxidase and xanthine dehydrogenase [Pelomyxa schiedti]
MMEEGNGAPEERQTTTTTTASAATATSTTTSMSAAAYVDSSAAGDDDLMRFQIELEFVQCLCNPEYLHYLARFHGKIFHDKAFINYLNYLQYWKQPQYARFLDYPNCLIFLELLQTESFREALESPDCAANIYHQMTQYHDWRMRLYSPQQLQAPQLPPLQPPEQPTNTPTQTNQVQSIRTPTEPLPPSQRF